MKTHHPTTRRPRRRVDEVAAPLAERAEAASLGRGLEALRSPRIGRAERVRAVLGLQRMVGNAQVGRVFSLIQRSKDAATPISDRQTASAIAWGIEAKLGEEAIRQLQTADGNVYRRPCDAIVRSSLSNKFAHYIAPAVRKHRQPTKTRDTHGGRMRYAPTPMKTMPIQH